MINRCRSEFDGDTHINAFGFDVAAAGSRIFEFVVIVRQIQLYIGYQSTAQADFIAVELVAHACSASLIINQQFFIPVVYDPGHRLGRNCGCGCRRAV